MSVVSVHSYGKTMLLLCSLKQHEKQCTSVFHENNLDIFCLKAEEKRKHVWALFHTLPNKDMLRKFALVYFYFVSFKPDAWLRTVRDSMIHHSSIMR